MVTAYSSSYGDPEGLHRDADFNDLSFCNSLDSGSTHHGSTHSTNVLALQPIFALPGDGCGKPSLQLDTGMADCATSQQVGLQCKFHV